MEAGDYMACFWAVDHKPSTIMTVDFDWKSIVAAKDWSNVAKKDSIDSACNSSALFLTAAAQNLLFLKLAEELGVTVANPWVSWFKAACLSAIVSLPATPFILYKLYHSETKDTLDAPAMAATRLELMGPVTKNEWVMVGTMLLAVGLWVFGLFRSCSP